MATRYMTDEDGERLAVPLDIDEYNALLERLEDLEATVAYDHAKASSEELVPLEEAFARLDRELGRE